MLPLGKQVYRSCILGGHFLRAAAAYHNAHVRNLRVRRVQADEIWAFVYGKDKNLTMEQVQAGAGS